MRFLHLLGLKPHRKVIMEVRILSIANKNPLAYVQRVHGAYWAAFWGSTRTESSFPSFHVIILFLTFSFPESLNQSSNQVSQAFTGHKLWADLKAIRWPVGWPMWLLNQPRDRGGRTPWGLKHIKKRQPAMRSLCGRREARHLRLTKIYPILEQFKKCKNM